MANGYAGYTGYNEASVKRQREIADALMARSLQQRGQPIQHWTQGAAQLAEALMARQADDRATKAESAYTDSRKKIADALLSSAFPGSEGMMSEELSAAKPFDLTPAGVQSRNAQMTANDRLAQQVKAMAQMTGNPLTAMQYGQGVQRQQIEDARYEQERKDERGKPVIASAGSRGFVRGEDGEFDEIFNVPDPSAAPLGSKAFAHVIQPDGSVGVIMNDASTRVTDLTAADSMRTVDVGGVPVVLSGRTGAGAPVSVGGAPGRAPGQALAAAPAPPVTAQTVGENKATIEDITTRQKAQTEAVIDLPRAIAAAEENIKVITDMLAHPGFDKRYGMESLGGYMPPMPGGEGAGAQAYINQVKGAAFLEAFESLRGGGQISNIEGTKAEQAKTRLSYQGISPPEARKAAQDLIDLMNARIRRAKAKAGMLPQEEWSKLSDEELEEIANGQ